MRSYFLTSERLGFDVWAPRDLALALGLWGDAQVTVFTGGPFSGAQVSERLTLEIAHRERYGSQYWPIFLRRSGEHVGCCGLRPHEPQAGIFEFGLQLRRAFWGQGFGREAAQAVVDHAFVVLGLAGLHAGHHPENHASRRILEGLGFRYTGDEFYPPTGLMEPCYALRQEGFARRRRLPPQ